MRPQGFGRTAGARTTPILRAFNLLTRPRFAFGTLCIFLYVGGEVAIGSLIVNYLMQPNALGMAAEFAGKHVSVLLGRRHGGAIHRRLSAAAVLAGQGLGLRRRHRHRLADDFGQHLGPVSGWSLLAIGLFNSIMFPTIFTLASEGLGERAAEGSGVICMAIVGGAIVPLVTGNAADLWGLKHALIVPAACYCGILVFGWFARRPLRAGAEPTFRSVAKPRHSVNFRHE